jgi:hypothetical protein
MCKISVNKGVLLAWALFGLSCIYMKPFGQLGTYGEFAKILYHCAILKFPW